MGNGMIPEPLELPELLPELPALPELMGMGAAFTGAVANAVAHNASAPATAARRKGRRFLGWDMGPPFALHHALIDGAEHPSDGIEESSVSYKRSRVPRTESRYSVRGTFR